MDKNFVRSIVDLVVTEFLEGGPGSGRYPKGSGKLKWHQPWDESPRDSPKVDFDKANRKIRKLEKEKRILLALKAEIEKL